MCRIVRKLGRPWVVVALFALVYAGLTLARNDCDPMAFALVGTRYAAGDPQGTSGYDGQFSYYIARDPANGWQFCDVPAYRLQRVLYPVLAWMLAFGQVEAVPWTLVALNVAALASGTYFTERLLLARGVSPWYALGYGLYGGLVSGLRLDLAEPTAHALLQAGLWAWERQRTSVSVGLFALSALAKETTLVAVAGVGLALLLNRDWRRAVWLGIGAVAPFVLWQAVLWAWLGAPGVGSGGAMATPFEWLPFGGLLRVATVSRPVFWRLLAVLGPLFVVPTLWALAASARAVAREQWHPWVLVLLVQALVLLFLPFSTWREPLAIARFATGLVSATLLYGALRRSKRILNYSMAWLATLALLIDESVLPV